MTNTRRFQLIGPHRRLWTAGIAAFAARPLLSWPRPVAAVARVGRVAPLRGGRSRHDHNDFGFRTSGGGTSGAGAAAGAGASTGANPSPQALGADLMKFSACMRSHGVPNFPNPVISSSGVSLTSRPAWPGQTKVRRSSDRLLRPAGSTHRRPTTQTLTTAEQADYLKAAQCMRDTAYRLPRP